MYDDDAFNRPFDGQENSPLRPVEAELEKLKIGIFFWLILMIMSLAVCGNTHITDKAERDFIYAMTYLYSVLPFAGRVKYSSEYQAARGVSMILPGCLAVVPVMFFDVLLKIYRQDQPVTLDQFELLLVLIGIYGLALYILFFERVMSRFEWFRRGLACKEDLSRRFAAWEKAFWRWLFAPVRAIFTQRRN